MRGVSASRLPLVRLPIVRTVFATCNKQNKINELERTSSGPSNTHKPKVVLDAPAEYQLLILKLFLIDVDSCSREASFTVLSDIYAKHGICDSN